MHSENDHLWYWDDHSFLPEHASRLGDMTTVHSWIFNGTAARYGALSPQSLRHAEWTIELSKAFATDSGRQVWLQEVGAPSMNLAEAEMPEFCSRTIEAALTTSDLFAVTWWCSHDLTRDLADYKDLEYSLGPGGAVFELWHDLRERGADVTVVTSATAADPAALEARGVTELVRAEVR